MHATGDRSLVDQWLQILQSKILNDKQSEALRMQEKCMNTSHAEDDIKDAASSGNSGGGTFNRSANSKALAVQLNGYVSSRRHLRTAIGSHVDWIRGLASDVNNRARN